MTDLPWRPYPLWGDGGGRIVAWGKCSKEDYEHVRRFKWWVSDGYACRSATINGVKTTVLMHRDIMGLQAGDPIEVDHENRDRLDNRRENLRIATRWENEGNKPRIGYSSRFTGVSFDSKRRRWKAQAAVNGVYVYLGIFDEEHEAAEARARFDRRIGRSDRSSYQAK